MCGREAVNTIGHTMKAQITEAWGGGWGWNRLRWCIVTIGACNTFKVEDKRPDWGYLPNRQFGLLGYSMWGTGVVLAAPMWRAFHRVWGVADSALVGQGVGLPVTHDIPLPMTFTWEGTLTHLTSWKVSSKNCKISSQRGTLETGPDKPLRPLTFHLRAAPFTPNRTYSESAQRAILGWSA